MSRRTDITFLLKDFPPGGGVERVTSNLAIEIAGSGKAVDIVVLDAGNRLEEVDTGQVRVVDLAVGLGRLPLPVKLAAACHAFGRYLREARPNAVVSAKEQANLVNAFCTPGQNRRTIITRHVPLDRMAAGSDSPPGLGRIYRHFYAARCDALIGVSDGISDEIRAVLKAPHQSKVVSVPNPVVDAHFTERATAPITSWPQGRVIVSVGRLTRQKGFDLLISAMAHLPSNHHLVIVGEGPDREELEAQAATLKVDGRVHLAGFQANALSYISKADVFVMPSRWEGLPTALIEALALDRPIVAADCKFGPRQILCDGRLGKLVDTEAVVPLAEAVLHSHQAPSQLDPMLFRREVDKYRVGSAARNYERIAL